MRGQLAFYGLITFILAYCSILYEFLLAQALSSVLGNTVHRFNLTIGFYIASMGIGALLNQRLIPHKLERALWRVEILLSLVGGVGPCLIILNFGVLNFLFSDPYFNEWASLWLTLFGHSLVIAIGFLSGLELPLLMRMASRENMRESFTILGLDYFGTFVGAILFPLVIFPNVNLFGIGFFIAFFNLLVALLLSYKRLGKAFFYKRATSLMTVVLITLFLSGFFFRSELADWLINDFYLYGTL